MDLLIGNCELFCNFYQCHTWIKCILWECKDSPLAPPPCSTSLCTDSGVPWTDWCGLMFHQLYHQHSTHNLLLVLIHLYKKEGKSFSIFTLSQYTLNSGVALIQITKKFTISNSQFHKGHANCNSLPVLFLKVLFVCEYWVQIYPWEHKVGFW